MTASPSPLRLAAFLRGVNVGGHRKLPMAALRTSLQTRGFSEVATYLQSGNVVCTGSGSAGQAAADIAAAIVADFGFDCSVIVRERHELLAILGAHPFEAEEADPARLHVYFADAAFDSAALDRVDRARFGDDRCEAIGRELYLHTPGGLGKSKLTIDVFERALGCNFTQRNWRSVQEVAALMG